MSSEIRFSVIMPAYNSADYIAKALDSALSQTYQPAEVIVINDGSTDDTVRIVQRFGERVRCISQENKGVAAARNLGLQNARYEWIALLDSDDLWRADKLELQAAAILGNPPVDFVCTGGYHFFEDKLERQMVAPPAAQLRERLMNGVPFAVSSVAFRLSKAIEIGGFDTAMKYCEDWDMWHRLLNAGAQCACVDEPVTFYRRNPNGLYHQAANVLEYEKRVVRRHVGCDSSAVERWWKHARLISRLESEAAIVLREMGSCDDFRHMRKSLYRFPLPLSLTDKRYKVALHMLLTKLGILRPKAGH